MHIYIHLFLRVRANIRIKCNCISRGVHNVRVRVDQGLASVRNKYQPEDDEY